MLRKVLIKPNFAMGRGFHNTASRFIAVGDKIPGVELDQGFPPTKVRTVCVVVVCAWASSPIADFSLSSLAAI